MAEQGNAPGTAPEKEQKPTGITEWKPKASEQLPNAVMQGYRFVVYIQGLKMGFSKVTNLETFIETDPLVEGGINTYAHSLVKSVSQEKTLTFERGMIGFLDYSFAQLMLLGRLQVGQRIPTDIAIAICNGGGVVQKMYFVHGATVKRWRCTDLDAMNDQVLIETFEVVYETLEERIDMAGGAALFGSII